MAAFQLKNFVSIVASMINWMRSTQTQITDFTEGAVARTLVEAPAAEIEELYRKYFDGLMQAIPVATYNSFNFSPLPAKATSGLVTVTINAQSMPTVIGAGSTFTYQNGAVSYTSASDVTIPAGNTSATVLVSASQSGTAGNIPSGTQFTVTPVPNGFVSASNLLPWVNGSDTETPAQQQLRFGAYIQALARGTVGAIEYGLSTVSLTDANGNVIEQVVSAVVIEPYETDNTQPVGLINCYIFNGVGNTSAMLVAQAAQVIYGFVNSSGAKIPGWKAAGTHVNIYVATEIFLNIGGALTALAGYQLDDLESDASEAAIAYVTSLAVGAEFEVSQLIANIKAIPGVDDFIPSDIAPPSAPVLGSVAGGALTAATYYVEITYTTPSGETLPSASASLAVGNAHLLTIVSPISMAGVTGWNVYVGTSAGSLTLQNAEPYAIGTNYTELTGGLITGASPPVDSTARFINVTPLKTQKLMPGAVSIN